MILISQLAKARIQLSQGHRSTLDKGQTLEHAI